MPISINPGEKNIKDSLEPSQKKIARFKFADKTANSEILARILMATEVIRSAVNWGQEALPGEGLKDLIDERKDENEDNWRDFLDELENPPGRRDNPNYPKPKLDNLPQEENEDR